MKPIRIHTNDGIRSGLLVTEGRKFLSVILLDNPIRVHKLPLDSKYRALEHRGKPYPLPRAKRKFRDAVKRFHGSLKNTSKGVREALG